ncbi:protein HGV2-like protein [Dinothrombium tinctorium]|uniref:Protein HGV2-like protein n=1 Tax=Dinothrombium tinctorium TaxID=1965070 RepID=A0A443QK02_9ACAR|nr:protein HGV2-like protein [Dinothrombium tinctorium]
MAENKPQSANQNDAFTRAFNLLVQGKRHLLVCDYHSAVQSLEETCKILDQTYGKGADECGEAYLFYGIALLELSRQETGALDGVVNTKKDKKQDTEEDIEDCDEKTPECEVSEKSEEKNDVLDIDTPGTSFGVTSKKEDENNEDAEISDLEVSFDVLTMASIIFRRQIDKGMEMKLKLAESLQKLGEVSIEWENNEHAITMLNECLAIRKECLPEDDRLIAETYYHIGIAHSFMSQIEKANDCYRSAINVISKRIDSQKKIMAESNDNEVKGKAEKEVWELESLLPEMRAKIEDSIDQMSTITDAKKKEETELMEEKMIAEKIKEVQTKPVNNVSHLVKRKRKDEPEVVAKKTCTQIAAHETNRIEGGKEVSSQVKN